MEIIFLGTGTSLCTPHIGDMMRLAKESPALYDTFDVSKLASSGDPRHNKNYRCNPSIILRIQEDNKPRHILIDCGKTFRESAIRWFHHHKITSIDYVLLTHGHADAIFGIDDLRSTQLTNQLLPIYQSIECRAATERIFNYLYPSYFDDENAASNLTSSSSAAYCQACANLVTIDYDDDDDDPVVSTTNDFNSTSDGINNINNNNNHSSNIFVNNEDNKTTIVNKVSLSNINGNRYHNKRVLRSNGNHNKSSSSSSRATTTCISTALSTPFTTTTTTTANNNPPIKSKKLRRFVAQIDWRYLFPYQMITDLPPSIHMIPLPVMHGEDMTCLGFLIQYHHTCICYFSDISRMLEETLIFIRHYIERHNLILNVLIVDCEGYGNNEKRKNATHFSMDESLELCRQLRPQKTYFIGIAHWIEYEECNSYVKSLYMSEQLDIELSYDGMNIFLL